MGKKSKSGKSATIDFSREVAIIITVNAPGVSTKKKLMVKSYGRSPEEVCSNCARSVSFSSLHDEQYISEELSKYGIAVPPDILKHSIITFRVDEPQSDTDLNREAMASKNGV